MNKDLTRLALLGGNSLLLGLLLNNLIRPKVLPIKENENILPGRTFLKPKRKKKPVKEASLGPIALLGTPLAGLSIGFMLSDYYRKQKALRELHQKIERMQREYKSAMTGMNPENKEKRNG